MSPSTKRWLLTALVVLVELVGVSAAAVTSLASSHPQLSSLLLAIGWVGLGIYGFKYIVIALVSSKDINLRPFYWAFFASIIVDVLLSTWYVLAAAATKGVDSGIAFVPIVVVAPVVMPILALVVYRSEKRWDILKKPSKKGR